MWAILFRRFCHTLPSHRDRKHGASHPHTSSVHMPLTGLTTAADGRRQNRASGRRAHTGGRPLPRLDRLSTTRKRVRAASPTRQLRCPLSLLAGGATIAIPRRAHTAELPWPASGGGEHASGCTTQASAAGPRRVMGCTRPIRVLVFIRADSGPMYMAGIENGMDRGEMKL
jgi:hypothetical protein